MRRRTFNQTAKADNRRKSALRGRLPRGERNLEGARHLDKRDVIAGNACRRKRIERACQQAIGDEVVELRHDDGNSQSGAFVRTLEVLHYRPLNTGLRFSKNARVPSRMSSVAVTMPNSAASSWHASANGISAPRLMASIAWRSAMGAFDESSAANARDSFIKLAAGTTRFTSPAASASSALTATPVRIISIAFVLPTRRTSRWVPANPGMRPRLISG